MKRLFVVLLMIVSGCGYTFQGTGTVLPADVRKIFIPLAENNSTELGLADTVTEALREQFDSYGVVTVVEKQSEADAVLRVTITQVKRSTRSVTSSTNAALQLDTKMSLGAELRRVTGAVLWRDSDISVSKSFGGDRRVVVTSSADFATQSLGAGDITNLDPREVSRGQEQEVLRLLAEDAARQLYDQSVAPDF
jgi:outer membrane lipopolysaccharide assembly protein LptE/RlpB